MRSGSIERADLATGMSGDRADYYQGNRKSPRFYLIVQPCNVHIATHDTSFELGQNFSPRIDYEALSWR